MNTVQTTKTPFVIFLDIDGVLYKDLNDGSILKKARELFPKEEYWEDFYSNIAASHYFNKDAIKNLDSIINEIEKTYDVWIVISSSWRENHTLSELKNDIFGIHKFSNYIVDMTPNLKKEKFKKLCKEEDCNSRCRATEIQFWLNAHPEVTNFVVLDDDQREHLKQNFGEHFHSIDHSSLLNDKSTTEVLNQYKDYRLKSSTAYQTPKVEATSLDKDEDEEKSITIWV